LARVQRLYSATRVRGARQVLVTATVVAPRSRACWRNSSVPADSPDWEMPTTKVSLKSRSTSYTVSSEVAVTAVSLAAMMLKAYRAYMAALSEVPRATSIT
jgi:hypothetical protein